MKTIRLFLSPLFSLLFCSCLMSAPDRSISASGDVPVQAGVPVHINATKGTDSVHDSGLFDRVLSGAGSVARGFGSAVYDNAFKCATEAVIASEIFPNRHVGATRLIPFGAAFAACLLHKIYKKAAESLLVYGYGTEKAVDDHIIARAFARFVSALAFVHSTRPDLVEYMLGRTGVDAPDLSADLVLRFKAIVYFEIVDSMIDSWGKSDISRIFQKMPYFLAGASAAFVSHAQTDAPVRLIEHFGRDMVDEPMLNALGTGAKKFIDYAVPAAAWQAGYVGTETVKEDELWYRIGIFTEIFVAAVIPFLMRHIDRHIDHA